MIATLTGNAAGGRAQQGELTPTFRNSERCGRGWPLLRARPVIRRLKVLTAAATFPTCWSIARWSLGVVGSMAYVRWMS